MASLTTVLMPVLLPMLIAMRWPQAEPLPREWNQPHGNAAGSAFVDVAPLASAPDERWRIKSKRVFAGPIVSQGKVLVALELDGKNELVALDGTTGSILARATLPAGAEPTALVAGDGLVLAFESKAIHGFRQSGAELKFEKSLAGAFAGEPVWCGGAAFVGKSGGGVQVIDWSAGRATALASKGLGRPSALVGAKALFTIDVDDKANKLMLLRWPLSGSGAAQKTGGPETLFTGGLLTSASGAVGGVLVGVEGKEGTEFCAWFGAGQQGGMVRKAGWRSVEWRDPPAAAGSRLYGLDRRDRLVEFDAKTDGQRPLVEQEGFPTGGKLGVPSIARDVLFVGNWALELARKKVLWCMPELTPIGPAVPIGDELLALRLESGELVGLGRAPEAVVTGAGAAPRIPPARATEVPGKGPGLIRTDGLFVPGKVTALPDGRWKIELKAGGTQEYEAEWLAAIDDGSGAADGVKRLGEELPLYRAFANVVGPRHAESLIPVFEKLRDANLPEEARRLFDEAVRFGLEPARADALAATLAGKAAAKGATTAAVKKQCAELEADTREVSVKAFRSGARWCAAQTAFVAATALAARAVEIDPEQADLEIVEDWVSSDFPQKAELADTLKEWLVWAGALLPSGGRFAVIDDSLARRISITKFSQGAIVLETRNIRLITRELDPKIVGPLLVRGEATVRALQKILGPSPTNLSAKTLLEVRLYKTRAEYMADSIAPPAWSGGCYSSSDSISRFYSEMGDRKSDPVQHSLEEVFAHELTHHYTDVRWLREKRGSESGSYWMVEGFAEFVASQALEIGRLGETFDDATVEPIDKTAAVARASVDMLLDLPFMLGLDSAAFHKELSDQSMGSFKLKHTLTEAPMTQRGLFYAQATAFTFFVIHRCPDGKSKYVEWLQRVYSGTALKEPWKEIGFATVFELRKAFREFLKGI